MALGFTHAPLSRAKVQSLSHKALVSFAIFAVAMLTVPLFELALPLEKDPMCIGSRLPAGK